jgi:hypothetical protein
MTSLELIWNCGENDKDAGYKTEDTISDMGAQVVHLWDRRGISMATACGSAELAGVVFAT